MSYVEIDVPAARRVGMLRAEVLRQAARGCPRAILRPVAGSSLLAPGHLRGPR